MHDGDAREDSDFWREEPTGLHRVISGLRRTDPTREVPVVPSRTAPLLRRRPASVGPGGSVARTRRHAGPGTTAAPYDVEAEHPDDVALPTGSTAPASPRKPIDPLLARIGAMSLVVALLVPVAVSLRGGDEMSRLSAATPASAAPSVAASVAATAAAEPAPAAAAADVTPAAETATTVLDPKSLPPATPVVVEAAPAPPAKAAAQATAAATAAVPAAAAVEHTVVKRSCAQKYTIVAGDYWILIAKKVSVTLKDLLAANGASTKTALYAGRSICLPANASTPTTVAAPPTTVKAVTTTTVKAVTTTTAAPKAPTTTVKPVTTTTAAPAPQRSYTRAEVAQIIRDVWPDDLEDEAIRIATRESNLQPTAKNYCCYGLFQIYYSVHKGWLASMYVVSPNQLFDPRVNALAGLALYNRNGWGPWKL